LKEWKVYWPGRREDGKGAGRNLGGIYWPGRREDGKGAGRNLFAGKAGRREGCGKEFICREGGKTGRVREGIYLPRRREDGKGAGRNLGGIYWPGRREGCGKGNIVIVITWKAQRFQKPDSFAAVRVFQNTI